MSKINLTEIMKGSRESIPKFLNTREKIERLRKEMYDEIAPQLEKLEEAQIESIKGAYKLVVYGNYALATNIRYSP